MYPVTRVVRFGATWSAGPAVRRTVLSGSYEGEGVAGTWPRFPAACVASRPRPCRRAGPGVLHVCPRVSAVFGKDPDELLRREEHRKSLQRDKACLWLDVKCRAVASEDTTGFRGADGAGQVARSLEEADLGLARRKPCIKAQTVECPAKNKKIKRCK